MYKVGTLLEALDTNYGVRTKGKIYEIIDSDSIEGEGYSTYINDSGSRSYVQSGNVDKFKVVKGDFDDFQIQANQRKKMLESITQDFFEDERDESPETLELDVWVVDNDLQDYLKGVNHYDLNIFTKEDLDGDEEGYSKAKLIVQKPEEKKVVITEKEVNEIFKKVKSVNTAMNRNDVLDMIKKELGF